MMVPFISMLRKRRTRLAHEEGAVAQAREQAAVQRPVLARTVDQHEHEAAAHAVQRRPVPDQATARAVSTPQRLAGGTSCATRTQANPVLVGQSASRTGCRRQDNREH